MDGTDRSLEIPTQGWCLGRPIKDFTAARQGHRCSRSCGRAGHEASSRVGNPSHSLTPHHSPGPPSAHMASTEHQHLPGRLSHTLTLTYTQPVPRSQGLCHRYMACPAQIPKQQVPCAVDAQPCVPPCPCPPGSVQSLNASNHQQNPTSRNTPARLWTGTLGSRDSAAPDAQAASSLWASESRSCQESQTQFSSEHFPALSAHLTVA